MNKASLISKGIILLLIGFGVKLLFSCKPYPIDPAFIDYNSLTITGLDNSGLYMDHSNAADTLYAEAVALKLTLADTAIDYTSSLHHEVNHPFAFQTLQADDISPSYIPRNKVVDIRVKTLFDINASMRAGEDITAHVLASTGNNYDIYHPLDQGISWLNGVRYDYEEGYLILILKASVENTQAQFEILVTLDNGMELLASTQQFTILTP